MLDNKTRTQIANDIERVFITRQQLPLLTKTYPNITVKDSYQIQQDLISRRIASGSVIRGYKVGLTSKAMQELAGCSEPDFSALTADLFSQPGSDLRASDFFAPLAEAEIAFVLSADLPGPNVSAKDVVDATDYILPALEIVDARVAMQPGMTIVDTVADFASCGTVILGTGPKKLSGFDLDEIACNAYKNDTFITQGRASDVLGSPVNSVAWLANRLFEYGVNFRKGDIILTGSMIRAFPIGPGDTVRFSFKGLLDDVTASLI
jgi:2-keto-4-pentenoate hydratase